MNWILVGFLWNEGDVAGDVFKMGEGNAEDADDGQNMANNALAGCCCVLLEFVE